MTTYKYKGQSLSGARVSGVVRAYDEFEAVAKLRDTCAFITKIEPVKERGNALDKPIGFRLKDKELALLCSQFSIILTSGLSVMRCVEMVASQTRNKYTRRMLEKVAEEVGAGYSLAQSFESNAPYLPATFIETVRAGEESGTLALCFDRLHRYYERTARTRAKIISTMTYPAMVIVVAIIVFIIIIAVAVPAFTDAFADLGEGELPGVTKALMAVSGFFNRWWWLLLLIAAALVIAYLAFKRTERGKLVLASYAIERAPLRRLRSRVSSAFTAAASARRFSTSLARYSRRDLRSICKAAISAQISSAFPRSSPVSSSTSMRSVRRRIASLISYNFMCCLRSDLTDGEFLHGVSGDDHRKSCLFSKKESQQLFANRHFSAGHDAAVHRLFGNRDVECVFHSFCLTFREG